MPDETSPLLRNVEGVPDADPDCDTATSASFGITPHDSRLHDKKTIDLVSVFFPMVIGLFLAAMDATIVVSSYAAIGSEFKQLKNVSWIATSYMLTVTCFQPLYGKMSDIFGRKLCLLFAYSTFALGCLCCALARNLWELVAARALAGIGGGGMSTVVSIIVSDIVPLRSRGTWQGAINVIFAVGSGTGAPLGGLLTDSIGWRWIFLIQVPITLLAIASVSIALKIPAKESADLREKLKRVDFPGALALILCIFTLLFGLDRGGNQSWSDPLTTYSLIACSVLFVVFGYIESKIAAEPFAPTRIVCGPTLIASYLVNFFSVAAGTATVFHILLYFQAVRGMKPSEIGVLLLPSIVSGVVGSLFGGLFTQATGKYFWITVAGYMTTVIGTTCTVLMAGSTAGSVRGVVFGLTVYGLGNGIGITTSLISLVANAGPEDQAIATAVSYLYRSLGAVVGVSIGSALLQATLRKELHRRLSGADVDEIIWRVRKSLDYVDQLDPNTAAIVRSSYGYGIQVTLWFTAGMSVCAFMFSFFIREKALSVNRSK